MRIAITHSTTYRTEGAARAIQALRLTPPSGQSQTVISWQVRVSGGGTPMRYTDAFGNLVELAASHGPVTDVRIVAEGIVDTADTAGVVGPGWEAMAADVCLRRTPLTTADDAIRDFAQGCRREDALSTLHAILDGLHEVVAYDTSASTSDTTAMAAFANRRGGLSGPCAYLHRRRPVARHPRPLCHRVSVDRWWRRRGAPCLGRGDDGRSRVGRL